MRLGIHITNKCNSLGRCYDYLKCSSDKNEECFDLIHSKLEEFIESGVNHLAISGGECTLFMDKLINLIERATSLRLSTSIKTNGWWGESNPEYAQKLYNAGLREMRITYGKFSGIDLINVKKAIEESEKLFDNIGKIDEFDVRSLTVIGELDEANQEAIDYIKSKPLFQFNQILDISTCRFQDEIPGYPKVSWDGKVFLGIEGLVEYANKKTLTNKYVGDLTTESFESIIARFKSIVNEIILLHGE